MTLEVPIPTIRERPATHNGLWKCSSCKKPNPKSFQRTYSCRNGLLNTLLPPYQAFKLLNCGIAQAMQTLMRVLISVRWAAPCLLLCKGCPRPLALLVGVLYKKPFSLSFVFTHFLS